MLTWTRTTKKNHKHSCASLAHLLLNDSLLWSSFHEKVILLFPTSSFMLNFCTESAIRTLQNWDKVGDIQSCQLDSFSRWFCGRIKYDMLTHSVALHMRYNHGILHKLITGKFSQFGNFIHHLGNRWNHCYWTGKRQLKKRCFFNAACSFLTNTTARGAINGWKNTWAINGWKNTWVQFTWWPFNLVTQIYLTQLSVIRLDGKWMHQAMRVCYIDKDFGGGGGLVMCSGKGR